MGKLWVQNFLRPPQERVKLVAPPPLPPFKVRLQWFWVYLVKLRYLKYINLNCISHFYFLNQDFFLTIISITLLFGDLVDNIHLEGNISQTFDLSPSFRFMTKNGNIFTIFCNLIF